jgi:mRNA interferase RelE/StbE
VRRPVVRFTPAAAKLVTKLHPEIKTMIRFALEELRSKPFLGDDLREELSGFKSFKPKRYRILYKFDEDENTFDVYYVGHRREVYEKFMLLLRQLQEQ